MPDGNIGIWREYCFASSVIVSDNMGLCLIISGLPLRVPSLWQQPNFSMVDAISAINRGQFN
jgi:hypothetical protein